MQPSTDDEHEVQRRGWLDMPEMRGELVRLVPLERRHAAGYLAASSGEEVALWLTVPAPRTLDDALQQIEPAAIAREAGQRLAFA